MLSTQKLPASPRFAGRPIGASSQPLSVIALESMEKMERREAELRMKNGKHFALGLLILAIVLAVGAWGMVGLSARLRSATQPTDPPRQSAMVIALWISAILLCMTFIIAAFARKESRSDVADQVFESGCRSEGRDPFLKIYFSLVAVALLHGQFIVVDAMKTTWVRRRLRNTDRHRAAVILGTMLANPVDIRTHTLLRVGEPPSHLRPVLAYLIAYEWLDISPGGRTVRLLSPAWRALRF